jgi:hypothetical protein
MTHYQKLIGEVLATADPALIDGEWTIDGMVPDQWAEAMYGEDAS